MQSYDLPQIENYSVSVLGNGWPAMHELIPPALVMLLGGMLNVVLSGPIASLDAAIFRGLGFPKSFIEFWGSEVVIRSAGWIAIVVSFALLVVGLFGG